MASNAENVSIWWRHHANIVACACKGTTLWWNGWINHPDDENDDLYLFDDVDAAFNVDYLLPILETTTNPINQKLCIKAWLNTKPCDTTERLEHIDEAVS